MEKRINPKWIIFSLFLLISVNSCIHKKEKALESSIKVLEKPDDIKYIRYESHNHYLNITPTDFPIDLDDVKDLDDAEIIGNEFSEVDLKNSIKLSLKEFPQLKSVINYKNNLNIKENELQQFDADSVYILGKKSIGADNFVFAYYNKLEVQRTHRKIIWIILDKNQQMRNLPKK